MSTSIHSAMLIPVSRHFWDNYLLEEIYSNLPLQRSPNEPIKINTLYENGGSCSIAFILSEQFPNNKIGIMVAASSGMPAGSIGLMMVGHNKKLLKSYLNKKSQE